MTKKLIIIPLAIAGLFWLYNTQIAVTPRGVIEDLDEAGMVVFSPHDVKSTITVFTDTVVGIVSNCTGKSARQSLAE